jgi:hypothetical protein
MYGGISEGFVGEDGVFWFPSTTTTAHLDVADPCLGSVGFDRLARRINGINHGAIATMSTCWCMEIGFFRNHNKMCQLENKLRFYKNPKRPKGPWRPIQLPPVSLTFRCTKLSRVQERFHCHQRGKSGNDGIWSLSDSVLRTTGMVW